MEKLYKLANVCKSQPEVLSNLIDLTGDERIKSLFQLISKKPKLTNAEAMYEICGFYNAKQFSVLKSKLFGLMVKTIATLDFGQSSEFDRSRKTIDNSRNNLAARVILSKGDRLLAIRILEDSLKKSELEHVSINVLDQLRILCLHYGAIHYNKYKLKKYTDMEKKYFHIVESESLASRYYVDLKKSQLQSFAAPTASELKKAKKYADHLQSIKGVSTRWFLFYKFQVMIKHLEYSGNYKEMLALCDKAERDFASKELYSASSLIIVKQIRLWALIQKGDYKGCIRIGRKDIYEHHISPINWYSSVHYTLKASLYHKDYKVACDLILFCLKHRHYRRLRDDLKEVVQLTLGYIHLIVDSGLAGKPETLKKKLPEFKLGKFLNTTPVFSKDKRGINVSIHLMHIAFLLQRKDYNRIIDRVDSLNQYAYRYLRKDDSFRSNCMIKMVIQMTKADFNPIRTERYTRDLRKQLTTITLAGSGENIEVEMIPFEVLWDIMMRAL